MNDNADREALSYLLLSDSWAGAELHEYRRAFISSNGAVFRNGKMEDASVDYSLAGFKRQRWGFAGKIVLGRVKRVAGTCVVCHNAFYRNYYHWLLEALPRLFCIRDEIRDARLILCADIEPFHRQTLELFGLRDVVLIARGEVAHAERLLLPGPAYAKYGQHNPELLKEMAAWMKERCANIEHRTLNIEHRTLNIDHGPRTRLPQECQWSPASTFNVQRSMFEARDSPPPGRRLYIGRGPDKRRKIVNEPELIALLEQHGFEAVRLEGRSFADQVALFSEVEVVAGIHGAGLANMLFMKPGGTVLEFINERYKDGCFFNLAAARGLRSVVLPCRLAGPTDESGPKYYDMEVDLQRVRECLKPVCP